MLNFAVNLSTCFTELPFLDRFAAAAAQGFKYVEYMFPYDYKPEELKAKLAAHNLKQVLFNLYPGNFAAGERGLASLSQRGQDFKDSIAQGLEYAQALEVKCVHCMSGCSDMERSKALPLVAERMHYAAEEFARINVKVVLEGINPFDMPGYFLSSLPQVMEVLNLAKHPNLYMLFDIYHTQRIHGELMNNFNIYQQSIGHVQIADTPGRHQPGTGEVHYENVLKHLEKQAYNGFIGLEYFPKGTDAFTWITKYGFNL